MSEALKLSDQLWVLQEFHAPGVLAPYMRDASETLRTQAAEIESLRAERDALKREAHENKQRARAFERNDKRYRWLRAQQWQENKLCVVLRPIDNIVLGTFIPSLKLLDDAIDHMSKDAAKEQQ